MKKFQEMCQEEFEKIELMARGGQKIVFDGVHNSYGETVIKLYFQLNDPRSLREIQIERDLNLSMVPKIYETGTIEYEGTETLYIIEQKVKGTELRKVLESGKRFSLEEAVTFLEQGLEFIACIENKGIVHRDRLRLNQLKSICFQILNQKDFCNRLWAYTILYYIIL